ncbi:hypothetical protein SDC9_172113 [bioreactor metagenome]|uniref:Uncharacterized protein n=1 Tax=bioreactor metagenome TaxID=1076179 RepID=A0A645GCS5_9ZZZZ
MYGQTTQESAGTTAPLDRSPRSVASGVLSVPNDRCCETQFLERDPSAKSIEIWPDAVHLPFLKFGFWSNDRCYSEIRRRQSVFPGIVWIIDSSACA